MDRYMDIKKFVDEGYLQELNRNFLHPLGLAISIEIDDTGQYTFGPIFDYRQDQEGIIFSEAHLTPEELAERKRKAQHIAYQWREMSKNRERILGYTVQPFNPEEE